MHPDQSVKVARAVLRARRDSFVGCLDVEARYERIGPLLVVTEFEIVRRPLDAPPVPHLRYEVRPEGVVEIEPDCFRLVDVARSGVVAPSQAAVA